MICSPYCFFHMLKNSIHDAWCGVFHCISNNPTSPTWLAHSLLLTPLFTHIMIHSNCRILFYFEGVNMYLFDSFKRTKETCFTVPWFEPWSNNLVSYFGSKHTSPFKNCNHKNKNSTFGFFWYMWTLITCWIILFI
jgi:hypothetical protein